MTQLSSHPKCQHTHTHWRKKNIYFFCLLLQEPKPFWWLFKTKTHQEDSLYQKHETVWHQRQQVGLSHTHTRTDTHKHTLSEAVVWQSSCSGSPAAGGRVFSGTGQEVNCCSTASSPGLFLCFLASWINLSYGSEDGSHDQIRWRRWVYIRQPLKAWKYVNSLLLRSWLSRCHVVPKSLLISSPTFSHDSSPRDVCVCVCHYHSQPEELMLNNRSSTQSSVLQPLRHFELLNCMFGIHVGTMLTKNILVWLLLKVLQFQFIQSGVYCCQTNPSSFCCRLTWNQLHVWIYWQQSCQTHTHTHAFAHTHAKCMVVSLLWIISLSWV